jgi:uncharacterized protein (DUF427 family)
MTLLGKLAHKLTFDEHPGRVRASVGGEVVFDTQRAKLLREGRLEPRLYVPVEDLNEAVLVPSDHSTHCPFKGDASYWSIRAGDRLVENAIWTYPEPIDPAPWLEGYASVFPDKVDEWLEEQPA